MANDPLSMWNDGPARTAILDFRRAGDAEGRAGLRSARRGHRDLRQRWHPVVRAAAAGASLLRLGPPQGSCGERPDLKTIHELGKKAVFDLAFATHAGGTEDEF